MYLLLTVLVLLCSACPSVLLILLFNNQDSPFIDYSKRRFLTRGSHSESSMTENQSCVITFASFIFSRLSSNNRLTTGSVSLFNILANLFSQTQVQSRGDQSSDTKPTNQ